MIITVLLVSIVIALGAITVHGFYSYAELKGYERGLDEAEQIIGDVRHGRISEHGN